MATNFPTSLDTLTNPSAGDPTTNPSHALQHANANDAIEALEAKVGINGSAVTTSLDYRMGLEFIKSVAVGTAVASVTVTDAFSSTYDNYRVIWTGGTVSVLALVEVYMGATPGGTAYQSARVSATTGGVANTVGTANGDRWVFGGVGSTTFAIVQFDLYGPQAARRTGFHAQYYEFGTSIAFGTTTGILDNNTQYTSFTLDGNGGASLTGGTIRVYGYKN